MHNEEGQMEIERAKNSIQVCMGKKPNFYAKLGRSMMLGNKEKQAFDEVIITGLGSATKIAIGTASIMEKELIGTIGKVETSYFSSNRIKRRLPKITIIMRKNPNLASN